MKTRISALALAALSVSAWSGCTSVSGANGKPDLSSTRPNIIFIFSDDHATHAISAYGSKINKTPNIDRLASEGVMFRNCFCGNSICGPSRATILSGKHSHANGFMRNGNRFDQSQVTFPKQLQAAGYQTAMIGKWHLTSDPVGFDHWIVLPGQGQYYNPDFKTEAGRIRKEGYCTDLTTQFALDWLSYERDKDKPFVLMCQHKAPHRSWMPGPEELGLYRDEDIPVPATLLDDYRGRGQAVREQEMSISSHMFSFYDLKLIPTEAEQKNLTGPDRWWKGMRDRMTKEQLAAWDAAYEAENRAFREANLQGDDLVRWKYQRYIKNYLRCVAGVDKSVGQLIDYVDADPELAANTIVIYCSDQGFYLGDHGWYDKRWMYEESLRMPFLVRWPGKIEAGREVDALAQNIDFGPTFLDLAGVKAPDDVHGESLVPLLTGDAPQDWRDAIYYHYYESHAVHQVAAHYGVRTDRHKLIHYYEPNHGYWELFDLETDPDELTNVYDDPAYAAVRARLETRLRELREQYGDTTGELGGGEFHVTAGIASAVPSGNGWRMRANTGGGYLLRTGDPLRGKTSLECTMHPGDADKPGNGLIIVTGGHPRRNLFRGGVDFQKGQLILMRNMKRIQTAKLDIGDRPVPVRVDVDLEAHTIRASSGGQSVEAALPKDWAEISAYGYGAGNCTTRFSDLEIQRE